MRHADYIITSTSENQTQIGQFFLRESFILPLYLDDTFTIDFIEKKYAPEFGYIGKYSNFRKRTDRIIDLLRLVSHDITFHFAGHITQEFSDMLLSIKNPNVGIHILGPIDFSEKINFYKDINFLFFPTELEGFGLPILEALRTSVIPIVLEDATIPESLKKACIRVKTVTDIDMVLDSFENDLEYYQSTIHKNYIYSLEFNENHLLDFLEKNIHI